MTNKLIQLPKCKTLTVQYSLTLDNKSHKYIYKHCQRIDTMLYINYLIYTCKVYTEIFHCADVIKEVGEVRQFAQGHSAF